MFPLHDWTAPPAVVIVSAGEGSPAPGTMFTSQRLRAVAAPGGAFVRETRLDDVVHQLDVGGALPPAAVPDVARRIDAALQAGVRWLIVDLSRATEVSDPMVAALVATARECRARRGEVIVAGAPADVGARIAAMEVAARPAVAATVDQAIMILKMLRPKTKLDGPQDRARQRVTSLTLPRIEPRASG